MYQHYFGLSEAPFSIAPDPRYLFMSQRHQEALAHLVFGINGGGGFVLLTGEVGTGKTTICRCLLEQIPESCDVAYIFNPRLTVEELLSTICIEFGIAVPPGTTSIKSFVDHINAYLLDAHARGRRTVLIIDEAQNLSPEVLEQMRLLTNLETSQRKLLQIILLGQPELGQMLERPELRQLAQRIVARYHLGPLSKPEVAAYMRHRLEVSGARRQLFPSSLMGRLYRLSGGVPRIINVLSDRALLGAYVQGKERVDRSTLNRAAREIVQRQRAEYLRKLGYLTMALLLLAGLALGAAAYRPRLWEAKADAPQAHPAAVIAKVQAAEPVAAIPAAGTAQAAPAEAVARRQEGFPDALDWPAGESFADSGAIAYASLFRVWGADYQGSDPCRQAITIGLRCRSSRGGLDELRYLDRPAVLRMRDRQGQSFYATLTALDNNAATFAIGAHTRTVGLEALAAQWTGFYTLLWRMPPTTQENIRLGQRGPAVEWLDAQLAQALGVPTSRPNKDSFDPELEREVRQFQLSQGLVPDGAAGPQTLMRLASVTDRKAPSLSHDQGGV